MRIAAIYQLPHAHVVELSLPEKRVARQAKVKVFRTNRDRIISLVRDPVRQCYGGPPRSRNEAGYADDATDTRRTLIETHGADRGTDAQSNCCGGQFDLPNKREIHRPPGLIDTHGEPIWVAYDEGTAQILLDGISIEEVAFHLYKTKVIATFVCEHVGMSRSPRPIAH